MPWNEVLLPPLAGTFRAVSLEGDLVAWTEHGLFRYEDYGTYPAVRLLHPPGKATERFDRAAGTIRWRDKTYALVGDPALVPHPAAEPHPGGADRRLEVDAKRRRVRVVDGGGAAELTVEGFPPAGRWHVASLGDWPGWLTLAHPGGVRVFRFTAEPEPPRSKWDGAGAGRDHAAILAAVLAHPDDDTPRLVYADWLEEHGDPARAEFIRLQCRLAERARDGPVDPEDPEAARAHELAWEHEPGWRGEWPKARGVTWQGFWRGFPVAQVDSPVTLARAGTRLGRETPVESARVYAPTAAGARALAASAVFGGLRVLELNVWRGDYKPAVRELAASPRAAGLRGLTVVGADADGLRAVADSPHLSGLEWLVLAGSETAREGLTALAGAAGLPALRWLDVSGLEPDRAAVRRLRGRFPKVLG